MPKEKETKICQRCGKQLTQTDMYQRDANNQYYHTWCADVCLAEWFCMKPELAHYKRAFEEVCRQFNYGDEKDYKTMQAAFWAMTRGGNMNKCVTTKDSQGKRG